MLMVLGGFMSLIEPKILNVLEMEQALCRFSTQEPVWDVARIVWLDPNLDRLVRFVWMSDMQDQIFSKRH